MQNETFYRLRAAEMKDLAETAETQEHREAYLRLSLSWSRLAGDCERHRNADCSSHFLTGRPGILLRQPS